jgi:hypothetical protein
MKISGDLTSNESIFPEDETSEPNTFNIANTTNIDPETDKVTELAL